MSTIINQPELFIILGIELPLAGRSIPSEGCAETISKNNLTLVPFNPLTDLDLRLGVQFLHSTGELL